VTASSHEALSWIEKGEHFDLALLDFQMNDIDGLTLTKKFRQYRNIKQLPIIILSSNAIPYKVENLVSNIILKPIKPNKLLTILSDLFTINQSKDAQQLEKEKTEFPPDLAQKYPLSILIAEDNTVNQMVIKMMFRRLGYLPDFVANGEEVLSSVERQHYDVIFMDIQMPIMDGLEATRELCRLLPFESRPRIVAMTANALAEDKRECELAGMDDYISKPVTVKALIDIVKKIK
jgi:CheY-like chemotaxis protein